MKKILNILVLLCGTSSLLFAQTVKVNEPEVCYMCHEDVKDEHAKKSQHTAFSGGKCSDCHNPHASRHATLLNDKVDKLCLSCHEDLKGLDELAAKHQPVVNGECLSCHDPHASDLGNQLVQSQGALCQSCHPAVSEWLKQTQVHSPVAGKDCMKCHDPHGSANAGILAKGVPQLCFGCHPQNAQFTTVHKGYNLANADCSTCHDPHASSNRGLLMANQHAPFEGGECSACHAAGAQSGGSFAIAGGIVNTCLTCHEDQKADKKADYHVHLEGENSCTNCHNPHASNVGSLLSSSQQTMCTKCHFTDVPAKDKAKFMTHGDQDCTICHSPHGADNDRYLVNSDVMVLCRTCHSSTHKGSHPMGEDVIDKRTNATLDCLSCHKMHGSGQEFYLAFNPDMDLCIQCHKR